MKNIYSRMYFRLFFCVCLAFSIYGVRAQEPGDTIIFPLHYRYSAITLFTGDAWQFFPRVRGTMAISFPYTVTDASGVFRTNVFTGQITDAYRGVRSYPLPLSFEVGRLHHFTNFGLAFPMINGMFSGGFRTSAGYGFLLYAGKRRRGDRRPVARRYAIKFSLGMSYTSNGPGARSLAFGSIDNLKKTLYFLGMEADPTFSTPVGRSGRETEVANDMKVYYSQREAVLLPRVSFAANPYRSGWRWEVQLGYSLPFYNGGAIAFEQESSDGGNGVGRVKLNADGLTTWFRRRAIGSAPYKFGGLYLGVLLGFGGHKTFSRGR